MPVRMTAYKCEYCGRMYESYSGAWKHEERCFANPERKACRTCEHCEYVSDGSPYEPDNGSGGDYVCYHFCVALMRPISIKKDKIGWQYDCEHYVQGKDNFGVEGPILPKRVAEVAR